MADLNSQAASAFGSALFQHLPTGGAAHSFSETMLPFSFKFFWLIGSFWHVASLLFWLTFSMQLNYNTFN